VLLHNGDLAPAELDQMVGNAGPGNPASGDHDTATCLHGCTPFSSRSALPLTPVRPTRPGSGRGACGRSPDTTPASSGSRWRTGDSPTSPPACPRPGA